MAKKAAKKKKGSDDIDDILNSVSSFITSERVRFLLGLVLNFFVIYVGVALISFFFTGGADQSAIENVSIRDLLANRGRIENWAGVRGAYIADLVMNRGFGIPSFFLLFFLGSLGVRLMNLCKMSLIKRFLLCSAMMLWSSLFLSFVLLKGYEDSFIYVGGQHGYYLSDLMIKNLGIPGTILFLIVSFLVIAICTSSKTIPFLQRMFNFNWFANWRKKREKIKKEKEFLASVEDDGDEDPDDFFDEEDEEDDDDDSDEIIQPSKVVPTIQATTSVMTGDDEEIEFTVDVPAGDTAEMYDISSMGEYDPRLDLSSYRFPTLELLKKYDQNDGVVNMDEQADNQRRIKQTLENFGISISSIKATVGPTLTLYEVVPAVGVRISKIRNLEDDIALSLSALGIRIIAPMPGKGTIGIEVPNKDAQIVSMQSVIASRKFIECKYDLPVAMGKMITNDVFIFDLCKAPHLLMAGATGQGKSVGLNAIITSLLYKKHPAELKFVLIDPKMVEFSIYEEIERHYLAKLPDEDKAIITDFTKVVHTLNSLCREMDDRYDLLTKAHVRNIKDYNEKFISRKLNPEKGHKFMPYIVVVIDEFGDLIMTAGKDIEMPIARIAQKARAVGIHMIIATQRPSTNIITGTIKANFPARMAFRVSSMIDSRTILDSPGANQLIGRGDLLFSQGSEVTRVQCAFVDTPEVESIATFIGEQVGYETAFKLPEYVPEGDGDKMPGSVDLSDRDPLFDEAARLIVIQQQGSTSLIQRKFAIGYNRAGRLMDQLEAAGVVGPYEGSKARQVLMDEYSLEQKLTLLKN
ncbi:MAG: DNA translocase FtsK [Tannerella sp.]|jgi:S-DNA-T family DNA segregation ATPase FtsK/SpoIIIE|nr:DNA translocase FtsK [Tannerella sp.]